MNKHVLFINLTKNIKAFYNYGRTYTMWPNANDCELTERQIIQYVRHWSLMGREWGVGSLGCDERTAGHCRPPVNRPYLLDPAGRAASDGLSTCVLQPRVLLLIAAAAAADRQSQNPHVDIEHHWNRGLVSLWIHIILPLCLDRRHRITHCVETMAVTAIKHVSVLYAQAACRGRQLNINYA